MPLDPAVGALMFAFLQHIQLAKKQNYEFLLFILPRSVRTLTKKLAMYVDQMQKNPDPPKL